MEIVNTLPETAWKDFVLRHPAGNIFHTPEMFAVFAAAKGHRPSLWATLDGDGVVQALLLPVQITLWEGPLRRLTSRAVVYGGVLGNPDPAGQAALKALLEAYTRRARRQVLFTELRNLSDTAPLQATLSACGFVYEGHLNYLVDLSGSPDDVMRNIGRRTRKHIRRALRKGVVTVKQAATLREVSACYALLQRTYAAARVPLADESLFRAAFEVLGPHGMVSFWLAYVDGEVAATSVELGYKDTLYGWYGGLDRTHARHNPGELLMWHVLKWGVEQGYRVYDFGGAGKPHEEYGVREFKAKFGGELVNFGRYTCTHQPFLLGLSRLGYQTLRRTKSLWK